MKLYRQQQPSRQRGAASLVVALIILFGMTMVAFYANRGLIFEQKTSANQYRATSAFEIAEAGIEWATARLNEPQKVDTACAASMVATDRTFRDKYLQHSISASGFAPVTNVRPGCRLPAGGVPVCSCPDAGNNPNLGAQNDPSFTVSFVPVPGDAESVEIRADGCTAQGTQCVPGSTHGASDATARVRVIVKLLPALRSGPQAALTAGGDVALSGATVNITNIDASTNGITVDAGLSAPGAASRVTTLPGLPPEASVLTNDGSLASLNTADSTGNALFRTYFGQSMANYKSDRGTTVICDPGVTACVAGAITCSGGPGCAAAVVTAVGNAKNQLWVDAQPEFTDANVPLAGLGSASRPVLLISPYAMTFSGSRPVYGVLFGASQTWNVLGGGTAVINGAVITRDDFNGAGNLMLTYDAGVLRKLRPVTGSMVRVPGSWRDFNL
jgi:PilX N-terminal